MKNSIKFLAPATAISTALLLFLSPVMAAAPDGVGPWADSVVSTSQGLMKNGLAVPPTRSNPNAALGVAENNTTEGNFYSLGFGGVITLGFDNGISSGVLLVEATNPGYPTETAKVEVSSDNITYVVAGNVSEDGQVNIPESVTCAKYVRITDTSDAANFPDATSDAYDVDGVQAQGEVCTPAVSPTPNPSPTPGGGSGGSCGCGGGKVTQVNNSTISIGVNSVAKTGNNKANQNTGGTTKVKSGDATSTVNIGVTGSTNTAEVNTCPCNPGNINANIIGNGAGSKNTIKINSGNKNKKP